VIVPFSYAFAGAYFRSDTIVTGRGYWTKLADSVLQFTGFPVIADTIPVNGGWNLIGAPTFPVRVAGVRSVPDSIVRTAFFGYAASYFAADSLRPTRGYWVKASQAGSLIVAPSSPESAPAAPAISLTAGAGSLRVEDAAGRRQTLYLSGQEMGEDALGFFELPPPPPGAAFDARFASGRLMEDVRALAGDGMTLDLRGAEMPVRVTWEPGPTAPAGELRAGHDRLRLDQSGTLVVHAPGTVVRFVGDAGPEVPLATSLHQNTPNPFNPSTVISFSLERQGRVELEVYDLLGRRVALLVEGERGAGVHRVAWDASGVASGVYLYRLKVSSGTGAAFQDTRKMLLLR
jgi:hypothetical protein